MNRAAVQRPPLVSVILPTFQRRELVRRAVASVFAQTFRDWELIVVDDGSTDGTRAALAPLEGRLTYRWQPNRGVSAARNAGLHLARGSIVAFLDSDNRWLPHHLDVLTQMLARHPEAIMATTCPGFVIGGRQSPDEAQVLHLRRRLTRFGGKAGFTSCLAVRRAAVDAVGGFDERLRALEDTDLWVRLGTLGPICTVRQRTLIRQSTSASLGDQARRNGDYLSAAQLSADNLVDAVQSLPAARRERMMDQVVAEVHLARAMRALSAGDASALSSELETACQLMPRLHDSPARMADWMGRHLPRFHVTLERLRALTMFAEAWPDPQADSARLARWLAIETALSSGRLREAARLVAGWSGGHNLRFLRRRARVLGKFTRRMHQNRRLPAPPGSPIDMGHASATGAQDGR